MGWRVVAALVVSFGACLASVSIAAESAPLLIGDEVRCPFQCHRRGVCTRGVCRCHRGFGGRSCERVEERSDVRVPLREWANSPRAPRAGDARGGAGGGGEADAAINTATGADGVGSAGDATGAPPPPSARPPRLKVCVMTCQVLQTSTTDDTDVVLPGLPLASHIATGGGHDVTLVFFLHDSSAVERHRRQWEQDARAAGVSDIHFVAVTRHYYLPMHLAHAFEAYAWLVDRSALGAPSFGVVHFADGHGLGYYTALAKHQDNELLDLRHTRLVGTAEVPHLWLTAPEGGGGRGLESVDDLEINFVERAAAAMLDDVLVPSRTTLAWMEERDWKLPGGGGGGRAGGNGSRAGEGTQARVKGGGGGVSVGTTHLLPRLLPPRRVPPPGNANDLAEPTAAAASSRAESADTHAPLPAVSEVVFLLEGPGGGGLGQGVSAGGQGRDQGVKDPSEGELYPAADVALATAAAEALLSTGTWPPPQGSPAVLASGLTAEQLAALASAHPTPPTAMFLTLGPRGDLPTAAQLVERTARERTWPFAWMVATANQGFAVAHLANRTRAPVLFAGRHRGLATLALVRRVLDQAGTDGGGDCGRRGRDGSGPDRSGSGVEQGGVATGDEQLHERSRFGSGCPATRATLVAAEGSGGEMLREIVEPARVIPSAPGASSGVDDVYDADIIEVGRSAVIELGAEGERIGTEASPGAAVAGGVLRALAGATPPVRGAVDEAVVAAAYLELYEAFAAAAVEEAAAGSSAAAGRWWPSPGGPAATADGKRWWESEENKGDDKGEDSTSSALLLSPRLPASDAEGLSKPQRPHLEANMRNAALRVVGIAIASGLPPSPHATAFFYEMTGSAASASSSTPPLPLPSYTGPVRVAVSVIITTYNRADLLRIAVASIVAQDFPAHAMELIVVDDGSPDPSIPEHLDALEADFDFKGRGWRLLREPNRYLGGARNAGARAARGKYLLFMDDDNAAKPYEVSAFVRAAESTGGDIFTSFVDFIWGKDAPTDEMNRRYSGRMGSNAVDINAKVRRSPSFVFLGGSVDVGLFKNCFGDANSFFRRSAFVALGGYSEDRKLGYEDWELYTRAVYAGFTLEVVPEALYHYRFTAGSMQKSTPYSRSRKRALRAYTERLQRARDSGPDEDAEMERIGKV